MNKVEKAYDDFDIEDKREAKASIVAGWGIYLSSLFLVFTLFRSVCMGNCKKNQLLNRF